MAQNQPTFIIEFIRKAVTAINRSAQGIVALVLEDDTLTDNVSVFNNFSEVDSTKVSAKTHLLLDLTFRGKPRKVILIKKQAQINDTVALLKKNRFNYVAMPAAQEADHTALKSYLEEVRSKLKGFGKAVLYNASNPDTQAIINFAEFDNAKISYNGVATEITGAEYTCRIAGILAGLSDTQSATYFELAEIVDMDLVADADASAAAGKLVVLFEDNKYKLGRAINSLVTLGTNVSADFQKIRIISTLDLIKEDIVTTYRNSYVGKYVNDYANKVRFCGAINTYLKKLTPLLLDENMTNEVKVSYEKNKLYLEGMGISTAEMSYEEVLQYNTGAYVGLDGTVAPTDVMEDLDLLINLFEGE